MALLDVVIWMLLVISPIIASRIGSSETGPR